MIGINILTLLKQESQSDSARLLPGENGSKIDKFPGKDLVSINPCFLMENHSRQCFLPAQSRFSGESWVTRLPGAQVMSWGGKSVSILLGKGWGRTDKPPCTSGLDSPVSHKG